jgi:hypothetical protein
MSCGEIEADASVASSVPAIFGLGNVDIDHAKAMTATAAIAARIMRLRICHLLIPDELRNDISASETLGQLPTRRRKAAQAGGERAPQITRASEIGPMIGSDNKDDLVSDLQLGTPPCGLFACKHSGLFRDFLLRLT